MGVDIIVWLIIDLGYISSNVGPSGASGGRAGVRRQSETTLVFARPCVASDDLECS